jgi:hypothetical protein
VNSRAKISLAPLLDRASASSNDDAMKSWLPEMARETKAPLIQPQSPADVARECSSTGASRAAPSLVVLVGGDACAEGLLVALALAVASCSLGAVDGVVSGVVLAAVVVVDELPRAMSKKDWEASS